MSSFWRRLRWRSGEARRHLVRGVCRRFYRDDHDPSRSVLIAGTARSGTTWLAEIVDSQIPSRLMFEPFHPELVQEFGAWEYFQYMRPEEDDPGLLDYCRRVLSGEIRHPWIDRRVEHLSSRLRVIKDIRASLFLRWLHRRFPELPIVFVLRHPCAVVSSRLELGWEADADIARLLRQPKLRRDFLADRAELIDRARTVEEKHAVVWCLSNLVPLRQFGRGELEVFYYEALCAKPRTEVPRLFEVLGCRHDEGVFRSLDRPSTTARSFSAVVTGDDRISGWQRRLSNAATRRVLDVVAAFGLGHIYDRSYMPLVDNPWDAPGDG